MKGDWRPRAEKKEPLPKRGKMGGTAGWKARPKYIIFYYMFGMSFLIL
jgi:hypothetical protein